MVAVMALCEEHLVLKGFHLDVYMDYYIIINKMKGLKSKEIRSTYDPQILFNRY